MPNSRKPFFIILIFIALCACSSLSSRREEVVDKRNKAVEYAEYGNNYYNQRKYTQAAEFYRLSLSYNGAIYYVPGIIQAYNSLGKTYLAMGQLESAINAFNNASIQADELGDDKYKAQCANHLGELCLNTKNYPKALQVFEDALAYAEDSSPDEEKAIINHNIGIAHKRLGNREVALEFFRTALKINTRKKLYEEVATNYFMLASVYSEMKDYETAMENAVLALENDKFVENSLGIAKDYYALGIISSKAGNNKAAYEFLKKSLFVYQSLEVISPDFSITRDKDTVLDYLADLAGELGLEEDAAYYQKQRDGE